MSSEVADGRDEVTTIQAPMMRQRGAAKTPDHAQRGDARGLLPGEYRGLAVPRDHPAKVGEQGLPT